MKHARNGAETSHRQDGAVHSRPPRRLLLAACALGLVVLAAAGWTNVVERPGQTGPSSHHAVVSAAPRTPASGTTTLPAVLPAAIAVAAALVAWCLVVERGSGARPLIVRFTTNRGPPGRSTPTRRR